MSNLDQGKKKFRITEAALHSHLHARMQQRGITREEVERTLNEGWEAMDAKPGTSGKSLVLLYEAEWEGQFYPEKEVTVYYKMVAERIVLLTVKARYGQDFHGDRLR